MVMASVKILSPFELRGLSLSELESLKKAYEEERSRLFSLFNARKLSERGKSQLQSLWNFAIPNVDKVIKEKKEKGG